MVNTQLSNKSMSCEISTQAYVIRAGLGEFLATFLVGFFALAGIAISVVANNPVDWLAYGLMWTASIFAVSAVFSQFDTAHLAFHITLVSFLCDTERKPGESFTSRVILAHIVIALMTILGWFTAASFWYVALPDAADYAKLTAAVPHATYSHFLQGVITFLVILANGHVHVFSEKAFNGLWGSLANALLIGLSITTFGPIMGGGFNFWRVLFPMFYAGNYDITAYGWFAVAEVVPPFITAILRNFVFASNKNKMQ